MKKRYVFLAFLIVFFIGFVGFVRSSINTEENQNYISKIMAEDDRLTEDYGVIKNYSIKKLRRSYGDVGVIEYDYYNIYVNGEKKSGLITIKLYKDKNGNIVRYALR